MASNQNGLPEGTDTIIPGASETHDAPPPSTSFEPAAGTDSPPSGTSFEPASGGSSGGLRDKIGETASGLKGQATDKARAYAVQGKDKATSALDNLVKLVDDAAGTIDEKVGEQYGAYARRASEAVAGFASTLKGKDVDELFDDAKEMVRKSPAVAIGAAAALGFVLARVLKAAGESGTDKADDKPQA